MKIAFKNTNLILFLLLLSLSPIFSQSDENRSVLEAKYCPTTESLYVHLDSNDVTDLNSYSYFEDEPCTELLDFSNLISIPGSSLSLLWKVDNGIDQHLTFIVSPPLDPAVPIDVSFDIVTIFYKKQITETPVEVIHYFCNINKQKAVIKWIYLIF